MNDDTLAHNPSPTDEPTITLSPSGEETAADAPLDSARRFGDYELLAEIARGGMGVVFRARQVSLNREVALKMILAGQLASAADVARFRAEAEAAASLEHPNILPIYEVGEHLGQHFFSMKFVGGGSLAGKTAERMHDPRKTVAMFVAVCRAVDYAHRRGILHRDLKPGNLLVDVDGTPYVTDFGLAKKVEGDSNLTQSGAILGTPGYMAPEQARAEKRLSTAVDIYSLGAILYELIAGAPPFRGENALETILQVLQQDPVSPQLLNPDADRDLALIALKCLEKSPEKRYASASALADDLQAYLEGRPVAARPVSSIERVLRWRKRNPALSAALAAAAFALTAGSVTSTVFGLNALESEKLAREQARRADGEAERANAEAARARDEAANARKNEAAEKVAVSNARRQLYFNQIALAQQHWRADDGEQVNRLLDAAPAEFRSWEWHYLDGLRRPELFSLPGNGQFTKTVSLSADGKRLLAFANSGLAGAQVWDLPTRTILSDIGLLTTGRSFAAGVISPNGAVVVLGDRNGGVSVWDAATGKLIRELGKFPAPVGNVSVSPDGARVLASTGGNFAWRIWELASGAEVPTPKAYHRHWHSHRVDALSGSKRTRNTTCDPRFSNRF
jgi:serine/threonine protein kinase